MKLLIKILYFSILVLFISVKSQQLLNDNSCFRIYLNENIIMSGSPNKYYNNTFTIANNTNDNYILNKRGFMGFGKVIDKKGETLSPYLIKPISDPAVWEIEDCKENIVLIPAKQTIKTVLYLDILKGWYRIDKSQEYFIKFETEHTKRSPYYFGCKAYIDSLSRKGYKIYEGKLTGKMILK